MKSNIKYIIAISVLCVVLLFFGLDKCGSLKKANELGGRFKEASEKAEIEKRINKEIIKNQNEQIKEKDKKIIKLSGEVIETNKDLTKAKGELGELQVEFNSLKECQVQYDKLVIAFNFAESMIDNLGMPIEYYDELGVKYVKFPEGSITFGLNEKYEKQVIISLAYKDMYESSENLLRIQSERVIELGKINKRIKLASNIKTGASVLIIIAIIGALI